MVILLIFENCGCYCKVQTIRTVPVCFAQVSSQVYTRLHCLTMSFAFHTDNFLDSRKAPKGQNTLSFWCDAAGKGSGTFTGVPDVTCSM
jgi:hypothetical protein